MNAFGNARLAGRYTVSSEDVSFDRTAKRRPVGFQH
jgi:hypothetical protein